MITPQELWNRCNEVRGRRSWGTLAGELSCSPAVFVGLKAGVWCSVHIYQRIVDWLVRPIGHPQDNSDRKPPTIKGGHHGDCSMCGDKHPAVAMWPKHDIEVSECALCRLCVKELREFTEPFWEPIRRLFQ